ncbi:MAG: DUF4417 domain-containing protein [Candidatus Riflebacteria bacterium]|nr:DUF4417 domain-containing protein [Candidatus Riflebacteria bacterium]
MNKKTLVDDGFNAQLVQNARFDGFLEIPCIEKPDKIILPKILVPFSKRKYVNSAEAFIVFYEHDIIFSDVLKYPQKYLEEFRKYRGIVAPDCSLYRDMPLVLQIYNVYRSRQIGHFFQTNGINVIANVRWGDERSYTTCELPEKFAFLGAPKNSILSIGTYGCIQGKENKLYFRNGLIGMLEELRPQIVLVYGSMPSSIFRGLEDKTSFIHYPDWISLKRKKENPNGSR